MARKPKTGLDYYNVQTDTFQNRKIRRLLKNFGSKGYLTYSYLRTEIYRDKGYFLEWDENTAFDVSDAINVKEQLVSEIVGYCSTVGLFNKELLLSENILTTKNIQEFWSQVSKQANRKNFEVEPRFSLIQSKGTPKRQESTPKRQETTLKRKEMPQRKGKERKVKEEYILKPLNDFISEIKKGEHNQAVELWYMDLKLKKGCLTQLLTKNFKGQLLTDEKVHENTLELKKHFKNYLNSLNRNGQLKQYKIKQVGAL